MTGGSSARSAVAVAVACVVGLGAGLLVAFLTRPSNADVRAAARSLVPLGAEIAKDTEVTGSPLVVGDYSVSVEYRGGAPDDDQLLAALERTAADRSWKETSRDQAPGAITINYERDRIMAVVQVLRNRGRVGGEVDTRRDAGAQNGRRNVAALVGAVVLGGATALALRLHSARRGR